MWSLVESIANHLLIAYIDEIIVNVPADRLESAPTKDIESLRDEILEDFKEYTFRVKSKFFRILWLTKTGDKLDVGVI